VIKVNTSGYGGRRLKKAILVHTNDPRFPELNLSIAGNVQEVVSINPRRVVLQGGADQVLTQSVIIMPRKEYSFRIVETQANQNKNFRYDLKQINSADRSYYLLKVENLRQKQGRYSGVIVMKTDSELKPNLTISVMGNIFEKPATGK